jgi:hypothetical protein
MNKTHFDQIIANYVDKFADLNSPATGQDETYKWRIAKQFKPKMDAALTASDEELSKALLSLRQLTYNLIDSTILPLTALSEYAKREPSTVRQMFLDLYSEDNGNLDMRMIKIVDFLETEEELRKKFFPTSWKFKNSVHSVTCYQTLYDPDHNYILKPSHCKKFADCIEFFDSWGCGTNTKLSVFYRMCDQVVDYIRENDALMKLHSSRYEMSPPDSLHPDTALHILAFDIIYCCSTFDLFHGITFNPAPNPKQLELQKELKKRQ